MSRMNNNGNKNHPQQQHHQQQGGGYNPNFMPGFPQAMGMAPSPPSARQQQQQSHQHRPHQQQQQHHSHQQQQQSHQQQPHQQQHRERLLQLKLQQQQLEMQLKQSKYPAQAQQSQQQPQHAQRQLSAQQQQQMIQQQQPKRRGSGGSSSTSLHQQSKRSSPSSSASMSSLVRPPDLKKPPNHLGGIPMSHQKSPQQLQRQSSTSHLNKPSTAMPSSSSTPSTTLAPSAQSQQASNNSTNAVPLVPPAPKPSSVRRESSSQAGAPPIVPTEQMKALMAQLNWADRAIYISRLLLGGSSVNGFLRSTATAQRIKKQRARQIKKQSTGESATSSNKPDGSSTTLPTPSTGTSTSSLPSAANPDGSTNEEEEALKKDAMNSRTAKKLRTELGMGVDFCKALHEQIEAALAEIDPSIQVAPLANTSASTTNKRNSGSASARRVSSSAMVLPSSAGGTTMMRPQQGPPAKKAATMGSTIVEKTVSATTTASPGDPNGSTLRKLRKRKLDPSLVPDLKIPDVDPSTGKKFTKKDQAFRLLDVHRFRALRVGDYAAAKLSSRDLWILSRVVQPYPGMSISAHEFLAAYTPENSSAQQQKRRDAMFRDKKVVIKDVEEKDSTTNTDSAIRSHILPLPRTFGEAADWGSRCRKGTRVYAMYPMTTSLYSGTVIDNSTYCRGDDDIIVVEFDGDETNRLGKLPHYHIPARFVTLIPREFPASQTNPKKRKSSTLLPSSSSIPSSSSNKRSSSSKHQLPKRGSAAAATKKKEPDEDSALDNMLDEISYSDLAAGGAGDLDFDLGFT